MAAHNPARRTLFRERLYYWAGMDSDSTKRKLFWLLFTVLSLVGWFLPFWWAVLEMFVALFASWWLIYRADII